MDRTKATLKIETDLTNGRSEAEISGTPSKILFNLVALTCQVCDELDLQPERLALTLPLLVRDYKNNLLKEKTVMGVNPFRREARTP